MAKIKTPQEPFGDVNILPKGDYIEVVASILMVPTIESAQVAIALDGSESAQSLYKLPVKKGGILRQDCSNIMESVAKTFSTYLTSFAGDGKVNLAYYSCGKTGNDIENIGTVTEDADTKLKIQGPKEWGKTALLLPGVQHFINTLEPSKWTLLIFVTNGKFTDIKKVEEFCLGVGHKIAIGKRNFVKMVMLGVGDIQEEPMEELDDMFEEENLTTQDGNDIDLWCHQGVNNMYRVEEIFAEITSENTMVAENGRIFDQNNKEIAYFPDGLPGKLRFQLPKGSASFTLEYPGGKIVQDIKSAL